MLINIWVDGSDPPQGRVLVESADGRVLVESADERPFEGWLQLLATLNELFAAQAGGGRPPG